jgi:hypothetical protein
MGHFAVKTRILTMVQNSGSADNGTQWFINESGHPPWLTKLLLIPKPSNY